RRHHLPAKRPRRLGRRRRGGRGGRLVRREQLREGLAMSTPMTLDYTIREIAAAPDAFDGKYPGEMRFLGAPLAAEQVALTYRRMVPGSGGKGSYGHRHRTQEEIYLVLRGRLEFKLDDDVVEVGPHTAVRVAPQVAR